MLLFYKYFSLFFCWFICPIFMISFLVSGMLEGSLSCFMVKFSLLSGFRWDSKFDFYMSHPALLCCLVLLICSSCVLVYVGHYFSPSKTSDSLSCLLLLFVAVMGFLFLSGSWVSFFFFWEYLGLVSVFLMLFGAQSANLRGALITLMVSRLGDAGLFLVVSVAHWYMFDKCYWAVVLSLILIIASKSALFPLMSWLPEAMRAPTPVSSLVHSSTLVTAGAWFLFRWFPVLDSSVLDFMLLLSMITILVSAGVSLFYDDLKKLMALSTCKKMAWCLVLAIEGSVEAALVQLAVHGVCKCALFVSAGDHMMVASGSQSLHNRFNVVQGWGFFSFWCVVPLILCLCGLPFLGLFFSKHVLAKQLFNLGCFGDLVCIVLGFLLTCVYSFRLLRLFLFSLGKVKFSLFSWYSVMIYLSVVGTALGVSLIWSVMLPEPTIGLGMLLFVSQIICCFLGWFWGGFCTMDFYGSNTLNFSDSVFKFMILSFLNVSEVVSSVYYRWESRLFTSGNELNTMIGFALSPWPIFWASALIVIFIVFLN